MKKSLRTISLLLGFVLAFSLHSNAGNLKALVTNGEGYSFRAANYPNTELEVSHQIISVAHSFRTQGLNYFTSAEDVAAVQAHLSFARTGNCLSAFPSKQYLFHIYPSHNFW